MPPGGAAVLVGYRRSQQAAGSVAAEIVAAGGTACGQQLAPEIRVNALAPGPISGNWEEEWSVAPDHIAEARAMNPMKRSGDPREIAETMLHQRPGDPRRRRLGSRGLATPKQASELTARTQELRHSGVLPARQHRARPHRRCCHGRASDRPQGPG